MNYKQKQKGVNPLIVFRSLLVTMQSARQGDNDGEPGGARGGTGAGGIVYIFKR